MEGKIIGASRLLNGDTQHGRQDKSNAVKEALNWAREAASQCDKNDRFQVSNRDFMRVKHL